MEARTGTDTLERVVAQRSNGAPADASPTRAHAETPRHRADPPIDPLATLAVVAVSYFSDVELTRCLTSLRSAESSRIRTWVVDNAQVDDLHRTMADHHGVQVLRPPSNLGYGGAVNFAVAHLPDDVEFVLVTNPDVRFTSSCLAAMVSHMREHPGTVIVGPRIRTPDGSIYPSARALPSLTVGTGHALVHSIWPGNPWSRRYLQHDVSSDEDVAPKSVGWLSGACMLVRRSVFEQLGGFDERFFMYFEDVDLCERVHERRWEVEYVPSSVVVHIGGTSTAAEPTRMLRAHHESAYRYLAKRYHQWYWAPLRWGIRGGLAVRAVPALLRARRGR
jgi:N-acetylglucosaminyl-diphospho-decaprenol L-rhamnosyltransferase